MGVTRPDWMDDMEWGEYQMTPEYAYELTHEPDYDIYPDDMPFDEPDVAYAECACGDIVDLWFDVNECDSCGQLFNAFGQKLKPEDEWDGDY
jgi:hypothetical protein